MKDSQSRLKERSALSAEEIAEMLLEKERKGELLSHRITFAAALGDQAAQLIRPELRSLDSTTKDQLESLVTWLREQDPELLLVFLQRAVKPSSKIHLIDATLNKVYEDLNDLIQHPDQKKAQQMYKNISEDDNFNFTPIHIHQDENTEAYIDVYDAAVYALLAASETILQLTNAQFNRAWQPLKNSANALRDIMSTYQEEGDDNWESAWKRLLQEISPELIEWAFSEQPGLLQKIQDSEKPEIHKKVREKMNDVLNPINELKLLSEGFTLLLQAAADDPSQLGALQQKFEKILEHAKIVVDQNDSVRIKETEDVLEHLVRVIEPFSFLDDPRYDEFRKMAFDRISDIEDEIEKK